MKFHNHFNVTEKAEILRFYQVWGLFTLRQGILFPTGIQTNMFSNKVPLSEQFWMNQYMYSAGGASSGISPGVHSSFDQIDEFTETPPVFIDACPSILGTRELDVKGD